MNEPIVRKNDSTTPPITQIKEQPAQLPQQRPLCPSQLEWPASHNKLGNAYSNTFTLSRISSTLPKENKASKHTPIN
eukprot:Pgem_evm1s11988